MNDDLVPCPICDGDVELVLDHTTEQIDWVRHKGRHCGLEFNAPRGEVVPAWNRRSDALSTSYRQGLEDAAKEIAALREALKPFAAATLPSTKQTLRDYNEHGLRCMMSPMDIARRNARRALKDNPNG